MPTIPSPTRFPVRIWLVSLAGWMFDFCDLVLFSFRVSSIAASHGVAGGFSVPLALALATGTWVWPLPETRSRNLAEVGR